MRTFVPPLAAALLALVCVVPARAEKWLWYPIKGGAVGYDEDSRKADIAKGVVAADTLIFYEKARPLDAETYSFVAERLEFDCREQKHRWSGSAVLDAEGRVVRTRPDGDWEPLPQELGSTALFERMLCLSQTPPGGKESADLKAAIADMKRGNAGIAALAGLAYAPPKAAEAPAQRTAPSTAPAPTAPPAQYAFAAPEPAPAAPPPPRAPTPAPEPKLVPADPPIAALSVEAVARTAEPGIALPTGTTPYPVADRCLYMKEGRDLKSQYAFNDCSYRVNYAWCVAGSQFSSAECGGPTIARGAGTVSARSNAASTYPGGLGRLYLFACRAPGLPSPKRSEDGRFTHECLGPATTAEAPQEKLPELRRLSP